MKPGKKSDAPESERLSDFKRPDMVYIAIVRSPVRKGVIRSISSPHLPRDYRFITAEDIPGSHSITFSGDSVPVLASGRVSYLGEPIGLIAGPDLKRVQEAIRLTRVDIDEEPASSSFEQFDSSRLLSRSRFARGDVDAGMAAATAVVHGEFRLGAVDHYYPEPQGAAAFYDYDKLIIATSTQWPFQVRDAAASVLAVKPEEVIVRPTYLGSHLDGKLWYPSLLACHAAIAARLLGRPALILLSREEDYLYTTKRAPFLGAYRAGIDAEGRLLALDARFSSNVGAHGPLADIITRKLCASAPGGYSCPAVRAEAWAVRSDLPPMGAYAGLGGASVNFALERIADECAAAVGQDPLAWRLANAAGRGDATTGLPIKKAVRLGTVADTLLPVSDYLRKRSAYELLRKRRFDQEAPPGFGIGMAFAWQSSDDVRALSPGISISVEAELGKDSILLLRTSVVPMDDQAIELWKREAAGVIGIEPEDVHVEAIATDIVPDSGPAAFSSGIGVISGLIIQACEGIQARRFREALPITVRKALRKKPPAASILEGASWGGAVVELSVDSLDSSAVIRGIWLVVSAGRIVSLEKARQSLQRDAVRAISNCVGEQFDPEAARGTASSLFLHTPLRLRDTPPIVVAFADPVAGSPPGGIGELAFSAIPPAFANALSQALDRPVNRLPARPGVPSEGSRT